MKKRKSTFKCKECQGNSCTVIVSMTEEAEKEYGIALPSELRCVFKDSVAPTNWKVKKIK